MHNSSKNWSKHELKIYLLLLCAQADNDQTQAEIDLIKSKADEKTFKSVYTEFKKDNEETSIEKIETSISTLHFTQMELADLKKEIHEIFRSDAKFSTSERYLDKILDNIVY